MLPDKKLGWGGFWGLFLPGNGKKEPVDGAEPLMELYKGWGARGALAVLVWGRGRT